MKAAINASPFIFLAKLERLDCLRLYEKIFTSNLVIQEIEKGLNKGHQEALWVQKLINEKFIVSKKTKKKKEGFGLHPGELSVIDLAKEMKIKNIIVDDRKAIQVAKYFGLKVVSTPFLFLRNLKMGRIEYEEFMDAFEGRIGLGYFISPDLYVKILEKAREFD
ncbi:MAG: hypothetical protein JSV56_05595 [Methanomassiliicoccales archaeon]|nr:MAG: hypothetical protein JSV56_05595 [Methanomassiliicoccales archaeon]